MAAKFFLGVADKRRNWNLEVPPTDFHECAETLLPVDDPTGCAFADLYREFSGPGLGLLDRGPAPASMHDWVCQDRIGECLVVANSADMSHCLGPLKARWPSCPP